MLTVPPLPHFSELAQSFLDDRYRDPSGRALLRYWQHQWCRYDSTVYVPLATKDVEVAMRQHIDRAYQQHAQRHHGYAKTVTTRLVQETIRALEALPDVFVESDVRPPAWLGGASPMQGDLIHAANALVELPVVATAPNPLLTPWPLTPDYFSFNRLPGTLDPTLADPPRFVRFLQETFEGDRERIAFVQEWMGYLLLPDTSRHEMLWLLGEGRNGKSVLLDVITDMLGASNVSTVPLDKLASRFGVAPTEHKLANICADLGQGAIDTGVLKRFTGADGMEIEAKYQDARSFRPTARVMVSVNTLPHLRDTTDGFWRRMRVLPFHRQVPLDEVDRQLTEKLRQERDQILLWAFIGLMRLRIHEFTHSQKMVEATRGYCEDSNPARNFLTSHYTADPAGVVVKETVYREYMQWAHQNGHAVMPPHLFGSEVTRTFPAVRPTRESSGARRYQYQGLTHTDRGIGAMGSEDDAA